MVYVELLFLEDLIYNYVILLTVSLLLTRITSIKKILVSSIIGTLSLITFILKIHNIIIILITFIFSLLMSIIAFTYKDIIYTIKNICYMYISSIFIAGFIYLINTNIIPDIDSYILKVIILILLAPIITIIYLKNINKLKNNYSNYYKLDIYLDEKNKITITGFLDTGNKLIDPYKQRPIILIKKEFIKIKSNKILLVPYKTVNSESLLKCIIPKKIYIHNIGYRKNFLIGLIDEVNIEGADCILHQKLLERI